MTRRPASWGFSPGTFGELLYGEIDQRPFLVNLLIPWGTRAVFVEGDGPLLVIPSYRKKARLVAEHLLAAWNKPVSGVLVVQSSLPIGKGMASSSADMLATLRALATYYHRHLTPAEMAAFCARVEPTDAIMFPGVVAFDPVEGRLLERLGRSPAAIIMGVLGHGRVNTEDHHRHRAPYAAHHEERLRKALKLARQGLAEGRLELVGQAGRISATVALERKPDPSIEALLAIADRERTGVIVAHSGTVRGLLVDPRTPRIDWRRLEDQLWALHAGPVHRIPVMAPRRQTLTGLSVWPSPSFKSPAGSHAPPSQAMDVSVPWDA